ncbi:hypothetical protein SCCGRSA3_00242 [Marine Group I thaumarchaeote SCGC RSA3]|uniref:Uncharacterized protein n=2 Tax=Marine Group I TaxID=905826 RepID=A0A081RQH5_9ARCH|nr:hypothetical protein AAA799N04_00140 [Marine Group I thaumarchaeote SCGC AAA799-N04]KFM20428.1 hypothetical protein SCCGRSA3_00242 [Marine Group I thaumarchaeote SCGC RSA3]
MKWIPSWLGKTYSKLYTEKNTEIFDFEEAKSILKIEEKAVLSLHLAKLENAGFLVSKRDSIDRRKKYFRLIAPNDAIFSYGLRSLASSDGVLDLFAVASKKMDLVIGGSYAAYIHSGYASPGKIDIYVNEKEKDRWIALLSDKSTSLSVDDILSEKTARTNVHIHSSLTKEMIDDSVELNGIRYVSLETLVTEGMLEQTEFSLTDAFSILVKKKDEIDFNKLLKSMKSENVERELGVCLELINLESGEKIFSNDIINKIHSSADFSKKKNFPKNKTEEAGEYKEIANKWKLKITFSKAFISKIILDLERWL